MLAGWAAAVLLQEVQRVEIDRPVAVTIDRADRTVTLTFDAPADGVAWIELAIAPQALPIVEFLDRDGATVRREFDARVTAGPASVRLRAASADALPGGPFEVVVRFRAETDASEPNDDLDHARPARFDEPVEMTISPYRDRDWVKLEAPSRGVVRWSVEGWSAQEAGNENPVVTFHAQGMEDRDNEWDVRVEPGAVYAEVRSHYWRWEERAVRTPFRVTFTFEEEWDASEPNDDREHSRGVTFDEEVELALSPRGERDWLRLEAPSRGIVRWSVEGWNAEETGNANPVVTFHAEGMEDRDNEWDVRVEAGALYAEVRSHYWRWEERAVRTPFRVVFTFEPEGDEREPNDDAEHAREAGFGEELELTLAPRGERDWIRLDAPSRGIVRWSVEGWNAEEAEHANPVVTFRAEGMEDRDNEWDVRVEPGTVYAEVRSHYWTSEALAVTTPFRVVFTFEEERDKSEPNDDAEHAREARFGEELVLALSPRGERDWIRLDAPSRGVVRWSVEAWDAEEAEHANPVVTFHMEGREDRDNEWDARVEPGMVYAEARAHYWGNEARAVATPFRLTFAFDEETDPTEPENDDPSGAREIAAGEPVRYQLAPTGDVDWFRLALDRADRLAWVTLDAPEGMRVIAALHDESGEPLDGMEASDAGTYLVAVRADPHPPGAPVDLVGTLFGESTRLTLENTTPDRAAEIRLNRAALLPADADERTYYFRLAVDRPVEVLFSASWPLGEGDVRAEGFGADTPVSIDPGGRVVAVAIRGRGLAAVMFEDFAHQLPPELRHLAARSLAEWAESLPPPPPPEPPRVTRRWTFDVEREDD